MGTNEGPRVGETARKTKLLKIGLSSRISVIGDATHIEVMIGRTKLDGESSGANLLKVKDLLLPTIVRASV
jgi:hypothetical protein